MGASKKIRKVLIFGIIALFIVSTVTSMVIGYEVITTNGDLIDEDYAFYRFDRHHFPEPYSSEKHILGELVDDFTSMVLPDFKETLSPLVIETRKKESTPVVMSGGPMDSPWPMHGHDIRHTGRSPYGIAENPGYEIWRFRTKDTADCSPVIDNDGTIYIGADEFYAVYPNGTLKWKYDVPYRIFASAPAIDENGIVYVGTIWAMPNYLYAFYTNNGTVKWAYDVGNSIESSPAIGDDGIIYFGDWSGNIHAVYPNGTRKWRYTTGDVVSSSPAIGQDGTVYVGSHDDYVYAFYPNNGTVKWKFKTGNWVHGSPTIGDDGTVYIGSDDDYLYALFPNNGTMKWRCQIGAARASPSLDENGTLYIGVWDKNFYAIYPNGTIKWTFNIGDRVWESSAAISADGTLYFGTSDISGSAPWALDIIALNSDGTEKWRHFIETSFSSPAIGKDGTVYIGSYGGLRAFGNYDPNAPDAPIISGRTIGKVGKEYDYKFTSIDPNGDDVYYYIEWGDGAVEDWIGPYGSGVKITLNHTWTQKRLYTIRARAQDTDNLLGPWGELEISMPMNQQTTSSSWWFLQWLQNHPRILPIIRQLFKLE
ncbi:MAG: PQQ-like beta-propeller repeat protein [Thermoplasmatales archaeon]|nr:MAG: PQQ-like beta-propeller repeat protein [Thermoplasmatales archaeon]